MRIAGEQFPPPPGGRRIPSVVSVKSNSEERPNARDLLATVNSASSGASTSWIAFLGSMAYLAVTLSGVTHVQLLLNEPTTLPFVNVKVPLDTFFVAGPLAFVLLHFGLLLQHVMLSRKLRAFEARLNKEQPSRNRCDQSIRDELHSHPFTQVVSGKPKGAAVDTALNLMMSLTLVVLPMGLLVFFQIGFLPYHSEPITWWHRGMLLVDVGLIVFLARHLARRDRKTKVRPTDWWHGTSTFKAKLIVRWRRMLHAALMAVSRPSLLVRGRHSGLVTARIVRSVLRGVRSSGAFIIRSIAPTRLVIVLLMVFAICVATLPNTPWDPMDKWMASIHVLSEPVPYCRPTKRITANGNEEERKCAEVTSATRHALNLTAYLFEREVNETTGKSDSLLGWSRNLIVTDKDLLGDDKKETRLSLRGRDFRYATLDRSQLTRSDFYGAKLGGARLVQTDLNSAKFRAAQFQGANLTGAQLQGADLSEADLQGADFKGAGLQGADFTVTRLQGADLSDARLQGANLNGANLQGADFTLARMQGANLSLAHLQGANLTGARLQGADLTGAGLQGANLSLAQLQGANLSEAGLQGANLTGAGLQGANLAGVRLQGANLSLAQLQGANLNRARLWKNSKPGDRGAPVDEDAWDLVSFAGMNIRSLDDRERDALAKTAMDLGKLQKEMAKESASGRERIEDSAKVVAARLGPLLETKDDHKWRFGEDLRGWCQLARQPLPDRAKVFTHLGTLACKDDTDKAYMAHQLIHRSFTSEPNALLEVLKGCLAFGRIPADLKSRLERAAQENRTNIARIELARDSARRACRDLSKSACAARWHVLRALRRKPGIFLGAVKGCPTFGRVPRDLKLMLSVASTKERRTDYWRGVQMMPPEVPEACATLLDNPSTTAGADKADP